MQDSDADVAQLPFQDECDEDLDLSAERSDPRFLHVDENSLSSKFPPRSRFHMYVG